MSCSLQLTKKLITRNALPVAGSPSGANLDFLASLESWHHEVITLPLSASCAPRSLAFGILRKPGEDSDFSAFHLSRYSRCNAYATRRRYDPYWAKRVCVATGAEWLVGLEALAISVGLCDICMFGAFYRFLLTLFDTTLIYSSTLICSTTLIYSLSLSNILATFCTFP